MALQAYAHLHDCTRCGTLDWGLQPVDQNNTDNTWDMIESYSEETGGIGVILKDVNGHSILFEVEKGVSGVFECFSNGRIVESAKALKNIVKNDHAHSAYGECAQKTEEAVEGKFAIFGGQGQSS